MAIVITDAVVDDADAYFATRLNSEAWTSGTEVDKLSALVTAGNLFNAMEWEGRPVSSAAAFPRYLNNDRVYTTPVQIKYALFEQAIHLLNNPGLLVEEDGVESLVIGPIQLQSMTTASLIPKIVKRYIAPFTRSSGLYGGGPTWWRAN